MGNEETPKLEPQNLPVLAGGAGPLTGQVSEGAVLAARYEIRERIGAGGMGVVHRAWDCNRACEVAIKLMHPRLVGSAKAREAFLKEARLSSELSHPGIVNVYDVERDGDLFFLTMELLRGKTLREELRHRAATGTSLTTDECLRIVLPLCDALRYAHERTVHRDVKPENVFLTDDGQVKLMDFGIARLIHEETDSSSGTSVGTAYYIAPEYLKGARTVDHRADQFGLAVMLYEMLTGVVPAGAVQPVRSLRSDVGKHLSQVVMRGISPSPQARFADMEVFGRRLQSQPTRRRVALASVVAVPLLALGWQAVAAQEPARSRELAKEEPPLVDEAQLNLIESELSTLAQVAASIRQRVAPSNPQEEPTTLIQLWGRTALLLERHYELSDVRIHAQGLQANLREFRERWPQPEEATAELRSMVAELQLHREELRAVVTLVPMLAELIDAGEAVFEVDSAFEEGRWTAALELAQGQSDARARTARTQARVGASERRWQAVSGAAEGEDRAEVVELLDQVRRDPTEERLTRLEDLMTDLEDQANQEVQRADNPRVELLKRFEPVGPEEVLVEGVSWPQRVRHVESGLELVLVPGGRFRFGADNGERNEVPSTQVTVAPFYLGRGEVPWSIFLAHDGVSSLPVTAKDHPAVGMEQAQAEAFCARLGLRLPTEVEWEWAAGGPAEHAFPWGGQWERGRSNGAGATRPPGARGVEAFPGDLAWCGALHLAGNVAELCAGSYSEDLSWAQGSALSTEEGDVPADAPLGPIVRGGSFQTYPRGCRTTARREGGQGSSDVGFRVAFTAPW